MTSLFARYRALPRVGKWVVCAVLVLVAFLVWDTGRVMTGEYRDRAAAVASELGELERLLNERQAGGGQFQRAVLRHGDVAWPQGSGAREAAVLDLITELIETLRVPDGHSTQFKTGSLRSAAVTELFGGRGVDRLLCTFSFEGSPETMTAVVKGLESSPLIIGVNSVSARIVDEATKRLSVRVETESWVWSEENRS